MGWTSTVADVDFRLNKAGAAVFSFTLAEPTTTTTAPPAAAKAVQATPAFTG